MKAKKSLGQHFLKDPRILQKIVDAARLAPTDTVLEVGPGEGTLTALLLPRAGRVIAVEKDDRLVPVLRKRFAREISLGTLTLIHKDILLFDSSSEKLTANSYKLLANLPYYITGQFLRKFLQDAAHPPTSMTLLLQQEVARRMVAADGRESLLSLSVKAYGTPRIVGTVKAGSFSPPPKVDSAIVTVTDISKKFFSSPICHSHENGNPGSKKGRLDSRLRGNDTEQAFFALLKKGFAHPRKLLASNLGVSPETLAACGIASQARAENVPLEGWRRLASAIAGWSRSK